MGATPVALLVGLATPGDLPVAWAQDLVSGIVAECARTGATVVGGDVSSADTIMLAVTALGDLAGNEPVTRPARGRATCWPSPGCWGTPRPAWRCWAPGWPSRRRW